MNRLSHLQAADQRGAGVRWRSRNRNPPYAFGNNSASVMGESYPGAGSALGPVLTFAYVAGRHIMGAND